MYQNKYLEYKNKYLALKNQINLSQMGGSGGGGGGGAVPGAGGAVPGAGGAVPAGGAAPAAGGGWNGPVVNVDSQGSYVQVAGEPGRKSFLDVRRAPLNPNDFENGSYRLIKSSFLNKYKETHEGLASTIEAFEHMDEKLAYRLDGYNPLEDPYIKDMLLVTCNNDPVAKAALLRLLRNILK